MNKVMKVNELMIGDWVDFYHPYEPEKKIVTRHCVTEVFECGLVGISNHQNPVHADHIESVKITPEILEKNGFVVESRENHGNNLQYCILTDGLWVDISGENFFEGKLEYVHQLQHALRLCGIDKTIEL